MTPQEIKILFKAVEDTSVKKVIDNIKGEAASIGDKAYGKGTLDFLKNLSEAKRRMVLKANPELAKVWSEFSSKAGKDSGAGFMKKFKEQMHRDSASFAKDLTFLMMPLMNPTSPWGTLFASRQTFSAFQTKAGQGMLGKFGITGIGGAMAATGIIVAAAASIGLALKALKREVVEIYKTFENARKLYAKSLMMGGLGLQYTVRRGMAANIIGVSERDVVQFAQAFNYLNPRIEWASNILARTTPALTTASWEFKVLGENIKASFSKIAADVSSPTKKITESLSGMVKGFMNFRDKIREIVDNSPLLKALGFKVIKEDEKDKVPPLAYMKQMKASSWERMGLVFGSLGGINPQTQTANNTKVIADNTTKLVTMSRGIPSTGGMFSPAQNHL